MLRHAALALLLTIPAGTPAVAQEWARKMFDTTSHDFGSLARGARAEYEFSLTNRYLKDIHIRSARPSCHCTDVRITKSLLKTYEKGGIIATIKTRSFLGRQGATITVTIDKPIYAQVQLHVTSYIHGDVVLDPSSVVLGDVDQGSEVEKKISVTCTRYRNWKILEVKSANPHLSGEVVEATRDADRVAYELCVRLDKDAPPGYVKDHLILVTNDRRSAEIPVLVEGRVLFEIAVSPASLFLGVMQPGQKVTKQLVVRSKKPFCITSATSDCNCLRVGTPADTVSKPLHVLPVTFTARNKPGRVAEKIRIQTDLDAPAVELYAYAVVSQ